MQIVKNIPARKFFQLRPEIKKKHFLGGKLWTRSYFVEAIGRANEKVIRAYVQNQLIEIDGTEEKVQQLGWF